MKELPQYIYNFILYTFRCVAQFGKTVQWTVFRERSESGMSAAFGTRRPITVLQLNNFIIGAWLSLVERCLREAEVAGSNPVAPIF